MQSPTAQEQNANIYTLSASEVIESLDNYEDAVSWVNDVLDPGDTMDNTHPLELTELDRRVAHLIGTLDIASEDTSSHVERIIEDISRGASRLTYDLHFMREGALSLQDTVHNVKAKSKASLSTETNSALERLHFLDTVKRNMQAAREVLREAESWGSLESDVTSLLSEQNYEKAAERLSEASKSMIVFQNTPELEARRTLMVSLQNQLEASLSSALVAAVNSQDVAVCRNFFSIFRNIQRESEFRNYYYGSRRTLLVDRWHDVRLQDSDPPSALAPTFAAFLTTFFSSFISVLQTERTSIPAIFPDPQPTLSALITSTMSALQPTFSQRLASLSAYYGPSSLTELITIFRVTQEFAVAADKIMEKIGYSAIFSNMNDGDDPAQTRPHIHRRSSRMSISRRMAPHRASISGNIQTALTSAAVTLGWDQELFEPFLDYQTDYGSWERRLLDVALKDTLGTGAHTDNDRSRLLRERSVDVFSLAEQAVSRNLAFTHGYGSVGLVKALDNLFCTFAAVSKAGVAAGRTSAGRGSLTASSSGEDLSDLDYTAEDWSEIQSLLHFLEAIRALLDRVTAFEAKLRSNLAQISSTFRLARQDPSGLYISGTTRGGVQLLLQSSLNSAELQELLNKVDPEPMLQSHSRSDSFLSPPPPTTDPLRSPQVMTRLQSPLLADTRGAVSDLARACQMALQDTLLSPLHKYLTLYASSPLWSAQGDGKDKRPAGSALSGVQVPTFSLSPSDIMQRVAEGLLNLPRIFEVYADDDALSFSIETLPFIDAEMLKSLTEPPPSDPSVSALPHSRRSPSLSLKSSAMTHIKPQIQVLTPEAVTAAWLSSLGLSLLSHLTKEVLPSIRTLTSMGAAQLASDLGYLSNIVMALNIECEDLEKWKEYSELDNSEGSEKVKANQSGEDAVLAVVAQLRGWT